MDISSDVNTIVWLKVLKFWNHAMEPMQIALVMVDTALSTHVIRLVFNQEIELLVQLLLTLSFKKLPKKVFNGS